MYKHVCTKYDIVSEEKGMECEYECEFRYVCKKFFKEDRAQSNF